MCSVLLVVVLVFLHGVVVVFAVVVLVSVIAIAIRVQVLGSTAPLPQAPSLSPCAPPSTPMRDRSVPLLGLRATPCWRPDSAVGQRMWEGPFP